MEKIAVVTGGSQGIGHEIVNTFVQNGYFVIFTYYKHKEQAGCYVDDILGNGNKHRET